MAKRAKKASVKQVQVAAPAAPEPDEQTPAATPSIEVSTPSNVDAADTPPPEPKPDEPARVDQWQCPACFKFGCPTTGGTKRRPRGVYRYRACKHCNHTFQTLQPHGGVERLFL